MADRVGQHLGNYRLIRLLGKGGFAEVYLGEHVYLETQAAIKVLLTQLASEDMEPFRLEAKRVAHLEHPHIVRVLEFGMDGSTPYLVMSYAPNGTLRERHLKGVALPLPTILGYVKQTAEALQYAHDEHFVHRDVKPENLLVGRRQEVLLGDFGIALLTQTSRSQSMQDVAGTVSYMAPEQFQGKPRPASDQYSLGVVIYEWLSGDRPFHGSFTEIATQHLFVPPPPLRQKMPELSSELEQVVMIALAKDPHHRFATIRAFATALEQASWGEASATIAADQFVHATDEKTSLSPSRHLTNVQAGEPFPPTELITPDSQVSIHTGPSTPTNQVASPAEGIPPLQPSSFTPPELEGPTLLPQVAPAVQEIPVPPTQQLGGSEAPGTVLVTYGGHSQAVKAVAWSPDGLRIASSSLDSAQVWEATHGKALTSTTGAYALAWSPDGTRIVSGSFKKVEVWDVSTGNTLLTYRYHSEPVEAVSWSPDGKRIVSGSGGSHSEKNLHLVDIWNASSGKTLISYGKHFEAVWAVSWSPDGLRIASVGGTIHVWDATTGHPAFTLKRYSLPAKAVAWSPDGRLIAHAGWDKTVEVRDARTGVSYLTYHGHSDWLNAVAWSPDGRLIASGGQDKTVQVWDAATGKTILSYHGHAESVNSVAWSPDGTRIASGSGNFQNSLDNTVQVWQAV